MTSDENPIESLEQRVAARERELRELRQLRATGSVLEAPFKVVDEHGQTIFLVHVSEAGTSLNLSQPDGHFLVRLGGIASGGHVGIVSAQGNEVLGFASSPHGGQISISDSEGRPVAWINVTEGGAHMVFRDHEGNTVKNLP